MLDAPRPLRTDLDGGSSGDSVFLIDAAAGLLLDATPAGWQTWGIDPAEVQPPLPLDRAMPALQALMACTDGRFEGMATFWTSRGVLGVPCTGQGIGEGRFVVRTGTRHGPDKSVHDARDCAHHGAGQGACVGDGIPTATHAPHRAARRTDGLPDVAAGARLAHELRTPLAAAIAYAEVLKDERFGPLANGRYRDYARNIYESARHALGVVESMLGGDPERTSPQQLAFADLDAAVVAESCLAVARPLAEEAQLRLEARLEPKLPRIIADEVSLKQMLLNLLTNAIKFARAGDSVTLSIASEIDGPLRIRVSDTGPGIDPSAPRRRNTGLGIGLPLTRALAEANGAALTIDSAPGRGTEVTIAFAKNRLVPV
jgi:signal transduction histidine kinase